MSKSSSGASVGAAASDSSRRTKVRFLRTSTWMVRALPVASACLISVVDFLTSVIFLRSGATVPWLACKKLNKRCLSASVKVSEGAVLATPADFNCSMSVSGDFLSSVANSAMVVLDICVRTFHDHYASAAESLVNQCSRAFMMRALASSSE